MPGASGLTVLRTVRQRDLDVPVLLMTGEPSVASAAEAVELGALRYLTKPFEPDVLVRAVEDALRIHDLAKTRREAVLLLQDARLGLGDRSVVEQRFRSALSSLRMVYQPIVSTRAREVLGFEALMRTGESAFANPGDLLAAAERLDSLNALGRAVRASVASAVPNSPARLMFVNLHTRDLLDEELYARSSPLSRVADRVVLEITERASLEDLGEMKTRIADLRKLGFRIAVDDLGAGYAGLSSFIKLRPDVVKFDMSLVRGIDADPARQRLVASMTAAFRDLEVTTVAEGVESTAEREALTRTGCDSLQGFLFAKPGPPFPEVVWD
jgi:EAL domain-containing protein (putative c-di-GMP-specific phosphodiesterase class I)